MKKNRQFVHPCPQLQAISKTVIAAPVSGTKYEWKAGPTGSGADLGAQKNVRIIAITAFVTWGVTQPTPLEIHVTIDGHSYTFTKADPVTGTNYDAILHSNVLEDAQILGAGGANNIYRSFLLEGREIKVEVELTWATTQPTNLTLMVDWAKW